MHFIKQIIGGLAIIVVAGAAGLIVNAMRAKPLTLVPRVAVAKSEPVETPAARAVESPESPGAALPVTDAELAAGELGIERVLALLPAPDVIVIDARGPEEYDEGHIPGALNVPYDRFIDFYDKLTELVPMDANVVCYCRSVDCDLSDNLAQELRLMGYEKVMVYKGGWMEWEAAGYPTQKTN